jgi:hypothetical protein
VNLLDLLFGTDRPATPVGPTSPGPSPARRTSQVIGPPPRFAWDEKRWRRVQDASGIHYVGVYRVWDRRSRIWRAFEGRVIEQGTEIKAYVADPPAELRSHSKGSCFQLVAVPWFRVHWHRPPTTVDHALLYVERLLAECLQ